MIIKAIKHKLTQGLKDDSLEELNDKHTGHNNHSIQDMMQCLNDNFNEVSPLEMEEAEKYMQQDFDVNSTFGTFVKHIEDTMDIVESARFAFKPEKIVNKAFNPVVKAQALPETGTRERRRKSSANKIWTKFKLYFSKEARDYHKDQGITAKNTFLVANTANQALLQEQEDFRDLTQNLKNDFKQQTQKFIYLMPSDTTLPVFQHVDQSHSNVNKNELFQLLKEFQDIKKMLHNN